MQCNPTATGESTPAPADARTLDIVLYPSLLDTVPQPRTVRWGELANDLAEHEERTTKDGPGWSATVYRLAATRGVGGVEDITAVVLDVDHEEPLWSLLDGLEYVAHTTWKHHASDEHKDCRGRGDCPHWRIVLPLERPVSVTEWEEFRSRVRSWLCPNADEGAKDAPRFFWLPTRRPGAPRDSRRGHGRWLDPGELKPAPNEQPQRDVVFPPATNGADGERPGDRFEREADWLRDILPAWKDVGVHGDNLMMRRPGSTTPYGATISKQGRGVLYVFTDGAAPLRPNTCYSKFAALATLEHGGDFKAAAKALAERYGPKLVRRKAKGESIGQIGLNGRAHEPSTPATNGSAHHEDPPVTPASPDAASITLKQTEMGLSELLVHRHGKDLRYCFPWSCFLTWDGRRYQRDRTGEARRRAKETVRSVYGIAEKTEDDTQRRSLLDWIKPFEKAARVAAILTLAEAEPGIPIVPEDMDADPFLFNVANGTLDLRSGRLTPHDRADALTKLAPVTYDAAAECPRFLSFLERVLPDADVRAFLRRFVGYCLTGDTSDQCLCFLHGGGANGKSTFLTVLLELLGDYGKQAAPDLLTHKSADRHPTELADVFGTRVVTSVEVDEGKRMAETLVKQMTGGDRMKARFMRGDFFEWTPTHKLVLAANHRPVIRGTDYAIWRRIHLVPFEVTIPQEERDGKLGEKLRAELPGILNWAIRGCLEWQQHGLGVPEAVQDATAHYRAEQDVLGDFLAEKCVKDGQATVAAAALYKAYTGWCEDGGEKPLNKNAFGRGLTEREFTQGRTKSGRSWQGLRLRGADEPFSGDAFGAGDAFGRNFPYSSSNSAYEDGIRKKASECVTDENASPAADEQSPLAACCGCGGVVDTDELMCSSCSEVTPRSRRRSRPTRGTNSRP